MDISVSYYSAIGTRDNNEDAVAIQECQNGLLALVADGLGGHARGEVASGIATSVISQQLLNQSPNESDLIDAIQLSSNKIFEAQDGKGSMRTTIAAVWIGDYIGLAANVGDSRIYQFRDGEIVYQSVDHSVAQMAVLVGEITQEDIRNNPDRNKLIRTLGNATAPKVDCECISVQKGDRLLICSDGFWEPVNERAMKNTIVRTKSAKDWLEEMKQIIMNEQNSDQDNNSAIAIVINE